MIDWINHYYPGDFYSIRISVDIFPDHPDVLSTDSWWMHLFGPEMKGKCWWQGDMTWHILDISRLKICSRPASLCYCFCRSKRTWLWTRCPQMTKLSFLWQRKNHSSRVTSDLAGPLKFRTSLGGSWVIGVPPVLIQFDGIFPNKNHPAIGIRVPPF